MIHELKIKECYWRKVWNGTKTFEIRKNDRNYQVGDIIHFHPIDESGNEITADDDFNNKYNNYLITYVFKGGEYGLDEDYCVLAIRQWIYFTKPDEELSRVRELISLLNLNPLDNILCAENENEQPYDVVDVLKGSGTIQGFSYLQIRESEL